MTLGHEQRPDGVNPTIATQTTIVSFNSYFLFSYFYVKIKLFYPPLNFLHYLSLNFLFTFLQPKTRHQRPYGWQNGALAPVSDRLPPRTVPTAAEKHREVQLTDPNFSDDSLEEVPPPPPPPVPPSKRGSIAWEVPIDDDEALYTPGSTKVIGRRRRRSTDRSSSGSMSRLRDQDEWPDPPTGTEDGSISPLSDSSHLDSSTASKHEDALAELSGTDLSSGGTYVIRKGRRHKNNERQNGELKRGSSTFDNIKSLLREGLIEGLDEAPPDFPPPNPPLSMVRVVSLPTITPADEARRQRDEQNRFKNLAAPNEADEERESPDLPTKHDIGIQSSDTDRKKEKSVVIVNGTTDTSSNEALMIELKKEYDTESMNNNEHAVLENTAKEEVLNDPWLTAAEISQVQVIPENSQEEKPPKEFKVKVEVLQHEFGPLPPSPVEEDDEYADVLRPSPVQTPRGKSGDKREPFYRCLEPPASDPLGTKFLNKANTDHHHRDGTSSLKTRSMDAGFTRNHRTQQSSSRREVCFNYQSAGERRTLPTELQGPSRRRTLQKRNNGNREECHMQVSCSLPETPIFARGCDIPRTPHRRAPDVPVSSRTTPRQMPSSSSYRTQELLGMSLTEAMAGAELLRLAGGPGRGWYPRHRQPRPASVEHLDRLNHSTTRKPQTLPPNLTPKFFHRSPREALRRVTSLLIRRGKLT
ncbi:hypothetical protein O3M35_005212 [Rhynocoris fuscipes]|uniref:Uncharacterized protein n=1 Tax=Rhynocoris fuscipes TaxID=488301 RepID=A0AAW1DHV0_9HEMI